MAAAGLGPVFSAVADPSRRALLQRLGHGPATTGQLAELLPMSRPAVSQHLKLLQEAGLVRTETRGRHRWHQLAPGPLELIGSWARDLSARPGSLTSAGAVGQTGEHMTQPVTYVEINSPDLNRSREFMSAVFGWQTQPFAAADYLVSPHGDGPGVDSGLLMSRDGQPRTVPVIRVDALEPSIARVREHGGRLVVEPFTLPGVGHGCYITDPAGVLIGLHAYDPEA